MTNIIETKPTTGGVNLGEYIVTWDYNGNGQITLTLKNGDDKLIQSIEHTKSKV
jgi:hypothetical protein